MQSSPQLCRYPAKRMGKPYESTLSFIAKEKALIELTHPEKALATARDILNNEDKSHVLFDCQSTLLNKR